MKYEQFTFQPMSSPTNVTPRRRLDRHDLAEQDRRVLAELIARLARDRDPERAEMPRQDRGVRVEIDRLLLLPRRRAEPAADVDLGDRVAGGAQPFDRLDRRRERPLEASQAIRQPAGSRVEMDRVDRAAVARGRRDGVVEPLEADPELRRPVAGVLEMLVVAGAGSRVDPDPDRRPRRPPAVALDLADRVEVEVDAAGEEDVEVAFGDVRAGVADLVGPPAALDRALDLARRAGIDADALRRSGRAEAAEDLEDLGERVGLEREPDPERQPGPGQRGLEAPGVLGEPRAVVDEERRAVLAGECLGVLADDPQPAVVVDVEAGPDPPRRGGARRSTTSARSVIGCMPAG